MSDKLHRFLFESTQVRGEWVRLSESWQMIQQTADYPVAVKKVLGEALGAISLLMESLKINGSMIMQIRGTQPVTLLVVQATSTGGLRAVAKWDGPIDENASFGDLFGKGTLVITIESQDSGKRYQSLVELSGDNLADSLQAYFEQSEQLSTRLWLAANDKTVSGFMLQNLPLDPAVKQHHDKLESYQNYWEHLTILADTISHDELLELDLPTLLHRLFHEETIRLFEGHSLAFECSCSQEKVENTIRSLGETEANEILEEQGSISIQCEFCNRLYNLDAVDVKHLFRATDSNPGGSQTIH